MRQAKRLFYIILLNIIISAITVIVVLQVWQHDHPALSSGSTPVVIIVTPTQGINLPVIANNAGGEENLSLETGEAITATLRATPTLKMLTYQVKEGDTLGALAVQFNTSVEDIMTVNNLTDPDSLYEGQIIIIPNGLLAHITATDIPPTVIPSATPRPSATATPGRTPTLTPTAPVQEAQLIISSVIGAGVLENEHVVLQRTGDGVLSLSGWRLDDGAGHEYIFPDLTLYKDSVINVNTRSGQNTVVDLYLGLTSPIWSSGKEVRLYDAENQLRSTFTIP